MNMVKRNIKGFTIIGKAFKGFTLIELLVAMSILAILSTIAFGSFRTAQMRSRDAQRKSDLKQISNALEMYFSDKKTYPGSSSGQILGCPTPTICAWGDGELSDGITSYFKKLPEDSSGFAYYYHTLNNDKSYQIFAHLENSEDKNCIDGDCTISTTPGGVNCGGNCNFAVFSSDVTATDDN
jgi:general secretion pathway protein G